MDGFSDSAFFENPINDQKIVVIDDGAMVFEFVGLDDSTTCSACWTGKYPTLIANGASA